MTTQDDFQSDLLSDDDDQNEDVSENIRDDHCTLCTKKRVLKKKINNLLNITQLQEITIKLLEQQFHLLNVKHDKHDGPFTSVDREECSRTAMIQIVENTVDSFIKYNEVYERCISFIKEFHKVAKKQNISNMSKSIRKLTKSVSATTEYVLSYSEFLFSSRKAIDECESILNYTEKLTDKETVNIMVDLFLTAIDKAEIASSKVKSIMVDFIYF